MKAEREEMEMATERKRQSILRMELEWAKRGCRARTTKQRARLERLEALKNGRAPVQDGTVAMDSVETRMGKKTVELHNVSKSYDRQPLIQNFDYIVLRNQRLGIIGPNGCGKSTLINPKTVLFISNHQPKFMISHRILKSTSESPQSSEPPQIQFLERATFLSAAFIPEVKRTTSSSGKSPCKL